jgi:hypothetical protein
MANSLGDPQMSRIVNALSAQPELELGDWTGDIPEIEDTPESTARLIELIDADKHEPLDDPKIAPYAWRLLSVRKKAEAIPAIIDYMLVSDDDDELAQDDIPRCLAKFGPDALTLIFEKLSAKDFHATEVWGFAGLLSAIDLIGDQNPESVPLIQSRLLTRLGDYRLTHPILNAFIINSLAHFRSEAAAELILEVYRYDFVDAEIAEWRWIVEKIPALAATSEPNKVPPLQGAVPPYIGDEDFARLLWSVGVEGPIEEVRLLVLGSILSIQNVLPSRVFEEIFTDLEGEALDFCTNGQMAYAMGQTLSLWNEMARYQNADYPLRDLSREVAKDPEFAAKPKIVARLRAISLVCNVDSFLFGLNLEDDALERLGADECRAFIAGLDQRISVIKKLANQQDALDFARLEELNSDLVRFWNDHYLKFAQTSQHVRLRQLEKRRFAEQHRGVGRNDPCPCGSGRKFKKCCVQAARN